MCETAKDGDSEVTTRNTQLVRPMWFRPRMDATNTHATHSAAPVFSPEIQNAMKKMKKLKFWNLSTLVLQFCLFVIIQWQGCCCVCACAEKDLKRESPWRIKWLLQALEQNRNLNGKPLAGSLVSHTRTHTDTHTKVQFGRVIQNGEWNFKMC